MNTGSGWRLMNWPLALRCMAQRLQTVCDPLGGLTQALRGHDHVSEVTSPFRLWLTSALRAIGEMSQTFRHGDEGAPQVMGSYLNAGLQGNLVERKFRLCDMTDFAHAGENQSLVS